MYEIEDPIMYARNELREARLDLAKVQKEKDDIEKILTRICDIVNGEEDSVRYIYAQVLDICIKYEKEK